MYTMLKNTTFSEQNCYESEGKVKEKDPDAHRSESEKKGFIRGRQKSVKILAGVRIAESQIKGRSKVNKTSKKPKLKHIRVV